MYKQHGYFMSIPFTYLIGWSALDKWYYGVRYGKSADPATLWTKYFTSSNYIRAMREKHGEPDVIQIRKTFTTKEAAGLWETKVIRHLKAVRSDKWNNRANAGKEYNLPPEKRARSHNTRQRISEARNMWLTKPENREKSARSARKVGRDSAAKIAAKAKERFADPEWKANVHDASHRTPEYVEATRIRTSELFKDDAYRERHLASVQTESYREKQRLDSLKRYENEEERRRHSETLKAANSSPEIRAMKSEVAKASSAKRIETRRKNNELREQGLLPPAKKRKMY